MEGWWIVWSGVGWGLKSDLAGFVLLCAAVGGGVLGLRAGCVGLRRSIVGRELSGRRGRGSEGSGGKCP